MNNFTFCAPTKVVFGKGVETQVGELCKEQGATKVLVHFGGQSAKKSGLLDRVYQGSAGKLVAAFLKEEKLTAQEREELRKLLDDMEV